MIIIKPLEKNPSTKHQTPNIKLQTPNSKLQTSISKLQTPNSKSNSIETIATIQAKTKPLANMQTDVVCHTIAPWDSVLDVSPVVDLYEFGI